MFDTALLEECQALVAQYRQEIVELTRQLVQIPSLPGQEGDVARVVVEVMQQLGYDQVWVDVAGNVNGLIRGGEGPVTLYSGHSDVVDVGHRAEWPYPPFEATVDEAGYIWGRGSTDMKGAIAGMMYAAALFKRWDHAPRGDLVVSVVTMEEIGGWGTLLWLEHNKELAVDRAVVGEPTQNYLLPGHRARFIFKAHFQGQSTHASLARHELNPLFSLARFIGGLPGLSELLSEQAGYVSISPTLTEGTPGSENVTQSALVQTLDVRGGPRAEAGRVQEALNGLLETNLDRGCSGRVETARLQVRTYNGLELEAENVVPGYALPEEHPWLEECRSKLRPVVGEEPLQEVAPFTCDASRLQQAGIPTVIFGPGDISLAHTVGEKLSIERLLESVVGYMALAL